MVARVRTVVSLEWEATGRATRDFWGELVKCCFLIRV